MSTIQQQDLWRPRTAAEFAQFFQTDLAPCLKACEQDRRKTAGNVLMLFAALAILAAIAGMVVLSNVPNPLSLLFVALPALAIAGVCYTLMTSGYRTRFKNNFIAQVVRFFGPDFEYEPSGYIGQERFEQCRIFQHHIDRYSGEDHIQGQAGKTAFECSEVHAQYKVRTKNGTHWYTIFKGLLFIADFNKYFNGTTLVLPDVAEAGLGWLGQKLQEMNFTRPGELVKLEDPEFERLFVVYSTDQVEARYILSPSLMHRLVEFRHRVGHPAHLSFMHGSVFVAVDPGKNLLEPTIFSPINFELAHASFQDLCFVLSIIEDLNLNTRIWTKQ